MSKGTPLNDDDRNSWLLDIRNYLSKDNNCIVSCSCLKKKYRDILRGKLDSVYSTSEKNDGFLDILFIFLNVEKDILLERLKARKNHFMKENMLKSQLDTLEYPNSLENDIFQIDIKESDCFVDDEFFNNFNFENFLK
jgi:gluconokinase